MEQSELEFRDELLEAVKECRKLGYKPTRFAAMIGAHPFEAVRSLLLKPDASDGFTELFLLKRLDLSIEAIVLKPKWRQFFVQELTIARARLAALGYRAPWDEQVTAEVIDSGRISVLLEELADSKGDRTEGKRIRHQLRSLGHRGGLRGAEYVDHHAARSPDMDASAIIVPPIPHPDALLQRIRALSGLPERNHEDVVKDLLLQLGFDVASILFQSGRIDVCILGSDRKPIAVFEVKRSIAIEAERSNARRQGMDYAAKTGALLIVLTDGDRYEVYDRRKGLDYETMRCGGFRLTAFRDVDSPILDLLRPERLTGSER